MNHINENTVLVFLLIMTGIVFFSYIMARLYERDLQKKAEKLKPEQDFIDSIFKIEYDIEHDDLTIFFKDNPDDPYSVHEFQGETYNYIIALQDRIRNNLDPTINPYK